MTESASLTLPALFAQTVNQHHMRPSMALIGETPFTYKEVEQKISLLTEKLLNLGLEPGDKVAILSTNMPNWAICFYAITFSGFVAVPVLPEFHSGEIENILLHSESKALFISESLRKKALDINLPESVFLIQIETFDLISENPGSEITASGNPFRVPSQVSEDDLASIIYTSGTMGKSKGVMLTHKNLAFTALMSDRVQEINEYDRFLSILPLSHTYENTIGMILPMIKGACVYYLGKSPTPALLMPALLKVRPTVMLTVPLIIEKIFRNVIQKKVKESFILHNLIRVPVFRKQFNRLAGKKLMKTFGGQLKFFGIGGAKLNRSVEQFLIEARFPYAIGYGLTESSPLLAGFNPQNFRLQTTGRPIEGIEIKIHNPDKKTGEGEIWAKGPNIMKGYYKEPGLTAEILTSDGWLKTGDLGVFDKDNYLSIRGRIKNTIILSGGENIYPEEIESVINNFRHVLDSLVLEKKGKLVALVHFNREEIEEKYRHKKQEAFNFVEHVTEELRHELKEYVNRRVNKFSQVHLVLVQEIPFEKTPTMKIKRYLYGSASNIG